MSSSTSHLPQTTRQWFLKEKPNGKLDASKHLELKTVPLFDGVETAGKILVKVTHIQLDPTNLIWHSQSPSLAIDRLYLPPVNVGAPVMAGVVGEVLESWHDEFKAGQTVYGYWSWAEHVLVDVELMKLYQNPTMTVPPQVDGGDFITLGLTAITAYLGLVEVGKVAAENCKTLVISAAAGATGSIAVQLAKSVLGIEKVIAIAGSDEKCAFCTNVLKADVALNYKSPDFAQKFIEATPDFIDVYFDNVGGKILQQAISRIAFKGRVIACGSISGYQSTDDPVALPLSSLLTITYQHASILGVIFTAYKERIPELAGKIVEFVMTGKVLPIKHEVPTKIEDVPAGLDLLFTGANVGKLILKLEQ